MDENFHPTPQAPSPNPQNRELFRPYWNETGSPGTGNTASQPAEAGRSSSTGSLLWLLAFLILLLSAPLLVRQFTYHAEYGRLKAGYDVATGALSELKPRLHDLELASRLVAKRVEPSVVSIGRNCRHERLHHHESSRH
jgi:hypothetical protein